MTVLVIPDGTTVIDKRFSKTFMTKLIIPGSVYCIDPYAFCACRDLQTVVICHGIKVLQYGMFYHCPSLEEITIPDSVIQISEYVFSGCTSLQTVTIPASVTTFGWGVFNGCPNLHRVWNKSKCEMIEAVLPWGYIQGETPPLKDLEKWTFALHWHWRYPDRITPEQAQRFTTGLYCLSVPTELCQAVFSYIPREWRL
jgi:hypothetical protein